MTAADPVRDPDSGPRLGADTFPDPIVEGDRRLMTRSIHPGDAGWRSGRLDAAAEMRGPPVPSAARPDSAGSPKLRPPARRSGLAAAAVVLPAAVPATAQDLGSPGPEARRDLQTGSPP
jgi:hypothetical protein